MGKVGLPLVLLSLYGTSPALALEKCLVVGTRGHFVGLHVVLKHLFVKFSELGNLFASAAAIKKSSVDKLDVTHWFGFASNKV